MAASESLLAGGRQQKETRKPRLCYPPMSPTENAVVPKEQHVAAIAQQSQLALGTAAGRPSGYRNWPPWREEWPVSPQQARRSSLGVARLAALHLRLGPLEPSRAPSAEVRAYGHSR